MLQSLLGEAVITGADLKNYTSIVRPHEKMIYANITDRLVACGPPPPSSAAIALSIAAIVGLKGRAARVIRTYINHKKMQAAVPLTATMTVCSIMTSSKRANTPTPDMRNWATWTLYAMHRKYVPVNSYVVYNASV